MSVFDKLMFWKKEPEFSSSSELPPFPGESGGFDNTLSRSDPFTSSPGFDQFGSGRSNVEPSGYPAPPPSAPNFGSASSYPSSPVSSTSSHDNTIISKNIELVSAKIDALQAAIDSMNQRLVNIENIARGEQEEKKYRRW